MAGSWAPNVQASVAVLVIGGILALTHIISVHVNGGISAG